MLIKCKKNNFDISLLIPIDCQNQQVYLPGCNISSAVQLLVCSIRTLDVFNLQIILANVEKHLQLHQRRCIPRASISVTDKLLSLWKGHRFLFAQARFESPLQETKILFKFIIALLEDNVSRSEWPHGIIRRLMNNELERYGKRRQWPNFRHHPGISLEDWRKPRKN